MLWSVIHVIFKTSSVTPDFFYIFNLVLSFSTCSQSFNKICVWEVLSAHVLNFNLFEFLATILEKGLFISNMFPSEHKAQYANEQKCKQ